MILLILCKVRADLLVTHPMRTLAFLRTIECSSTGTLEQIAAIGSFQSRAGITRLYIVTTKRCRNPVVDANNLLLVLLLLLLLLLLLFCKIRTELLVYLPV